MNEERLKQYFAIYTDAWKLFKKYAEPVEEDAFWDSLQQEAREIYEKYKTAFAKEIIVSTVNEIDRIYRKKQDTQ